MNDRYVYLLVHVMLAVRKEFPSFRIVRKRDSLFMKMLNILIVVFTLGQQRKFMTNYATTIGTTMYVHSGWTSMSSLSKCCLLCHERMHMRQSRQYGLLLYSLLYLFVPLPFVFSYYRAKFEKEAYAETMKFASIHDGKPKLKNVEFRKHILDHFLTGKYGWMWPFRKSMDRWYDGVVSDIEKNGS